MYFSAISPTLGRELARFQPLRLRIDKTVDDASGDNQAQPGELLTYTLAIENEWERMDRNVVIFDEAPEGTTFVPGSVRIVSNGTASNVSIREGNGTEDKSLQVFINNLPAASGLRLEMTTRRRAEPAP